MLYFNQSIYSDPITYPTVYKGRSSAARRHQRDQIIYACIPDKTEESGRSRGGKVCCGCGMGCFHLSPAKETKWEEKTLG